MEEDPQPNRETLKGQSVGMLEKKLVKAHLHALSSEVAYMYLTNIVKERMSSLQKSFLSV